MKTASRWPVWVLALVLSTAATYAVDLDDTRLLTEPAISADHIAFAYAGDLWVANRDGSSPRRLTSHEGSESDPTFSPDGQWIAFNAEYDGNTDIYLVATAGGVPTRLTWHPGFDNVEDFTPDGKAVLFSSQRASFTSRYAQLFTVPVGGGHPTQLPIPNGLRAEYSPDGSKIAYIPISERFFEWKHYRGGTTSRIWIYDVGDHSVRQIPQPEGRCNDTDPTWQGDRIFFRSDRNGELNVFSFDPATDVVEQVTRHDEFPVLALSGADGGGGLIYEQAGYLHRLDPATGTSDRLRIGVAADLVETRPRWVEGSEWIRGAGLSPSGARAVFEYRGEILTLPAKKGDMRNITESPGVHERSPAWSPDGASIAYFSDQGGEYKLHVAPQDGRGEAEIYELEGHGFYFEPRWSPDGRYISYQDNSKSLYVLDLEQGGIEKIATEPHYRPGIVSGTHTWSGDSRWLAYTLNTEAEINQVWLYDTVRGTSHPVTDGLSDVADPVFDQGGEYLYFTASTDAGPVKNWFAMSNADAQQTSDVYVAVLDDDTESPLKPESDEEEIGAGEEEDGENGAGDEGDDQEGDDDSEDSEEDEADGKTEDEAPAVEVELDRIGQRILALPLPTGQYADLAAGSEGTLYYRRRASGAEPWKLAMFSLESREETVLHEGVNGFTLSADRKKLLYVAGDSWGIADAGKKIDPSETRLAVGKLQVKIDPRAEWRQIFDEAWRINRDYFYDPGMHGADWQAMGERYTQFLPHLTNRADLNRLLRWLGSELAVGHHRSGGGDQRADVDQVPGGLLGADYEIDGGRYRFARVYGGLNWNPELRAPLTEPGVDVRAGEYLLAVDGEPLEASDNIYQRFENTAGKIVEIEVGPDPSGRDSRTVEVVPIENEGALRNRAWVEGNLRKVDEATDGRVAYVYVPNTARQGHTYFKRYFFPQVHKDAVIIDERFNGGGQVADYYIDLLRRPYITHWATRYGADIATPSGAIFGPKVMIIDETAGSGGDLLPWMFHKLGIGTLVGKRTWGGLVGTLGFPVLLDGGFVTAPNLGIFTDEGFVVENVGVPPDIEVEQWPAEVIAGRDPQLEKAIEIALEQLESMEQPEWEFEKPDFPVRVLEESDDGP